MIIVDMYKGWVDGMVTKTPSRASHRIFIALIGKYVFLAGAELCFVGKKKSPEYLGKRMEITAWYDSQRFYNYRPVSKQL